MLAFQFECQIFTQPHFGALSMPNGSSQSEKGLEQKMVSFFKERDIHLSGIMENYFLTVLQKMHVVLG